VTAKEFYQGGEWNSEEWDGSSNNADIVRIWESSDTV
jgi:hypothetical protein